MPQGWCVVKEPECCKDLPTTRVKGRRPGRLMSVSKGTNWPLSASLKSGQGALSLGVNPAHSGIFWASSRKIVLGAAVFHGEAHLDRDLADDLPVGPHPVTGHGLVQQPQLPGAADEGPFLLGVHRHRQHHLGQLGGIRQEGILHDDKGHFL